MDYLNVRPIKAVEVISTDVLDDTVLYHPAREEAISLNVSSAAVWESCDGTRTVAEIGCELSELTGAPEADVLVDVEQAVKKFLKLSLLHIGTANSSQEDS
jgi:hypothetical protein